jgi:SOS-response transcriptional repressor LexA
VTAERGLTVRQRRILKYLIGYVQTNGFPPTIREIADNTGLESTSSVHHQLGVLEALGKIRRPIDGGSRAIDIRPSLTDHPFLETA